MDRRYQLLVLVPLLIAPKCIEQDPFYAVTDVGTSTSTTAGEDAAVTGFVPAVACPRRQDGAHAAQIDIASRAYVISCGCAEANGKTCTIPRGTFLTWRFADSEEHDVSSQSFGESGDRIAGTWVVRFTEAGQFPYLCNIHSADMNGYTIIVQ